MNEVVDAFVDGRNKVVGNDSSHNGVLYYRGSEYARKEGRKIKVSLAPHYRNSVFVRRINYLLERSGGLEKLEVCRKTVAGRKLLLVTYPDREGKLVKREIARSDSFEFSV